MRGHNRACACTAGGSLAANSYLTKVSLSCAGVGAGLLGAIPGRGLFCAHVIAYAATTDLQARPSVGAPAMPLPSRIRTFALL